MFINLKEFSQRNVLIFFVAGIFFRDQITLRREHLQFDHLTFTFSASSIQNNYIHIIQTDNNKRKNNAIFNLHQTKEKRNSIPFWTVYVNKKQILFKISHI